MSYPPFGVWPPVVASGGAADVASEFWAPPTDPSDENAEFTDDLNGVPTDWTIGLRNAASGLWSPGTNSGDVISQAKVVGFNYRVSCGSRRRSWLQLQPPAGAADSLGAYRSLAAVPDEGPIHYRTRISLGQQMFAETGNGQSAFGGFYIGPADVNGKPDVSVTNGISFRCSRIVNTDDLVWQLFARNAGSDLIGSFTVLDRKFNFMDFEFIYEVNVSASGQSRIFLRNGGDEIAMQNPTGNLELDDTIGPLLHAGAPVFATYLTNCGGNVGCCPVYAADYFRRYPGFYCG